jgi:hypothetical protein
VMDIQSRTAVAARPLDKGLWGERLKPISPPRAGLFRENGSVLQGWVSCGSDIRGDQAAAKNNDVVLCGIKPLGIK